MPDRFSLSDNHPKLLKMSASLQIFYDTYVAFQEYFKEEKADTIARKGGLKCRRINKIVPHVCFVHFEYLMSLSLSFPCSAPVCATRDLSRYTTVY